MRVVFVHGACVRDGWWWWHRTAQVLREQGVESGAPPLPSCGETGVPAGLEGAGLPEDVAAVRELLKDGDEATVVVAHSYGGIVTAEAAAGIGSVRHLLLISSYLPDVGQSLSSFGDGAPAPFLDVDLDAGTFGVRRDALVETFLQDCEDDLKAQATARLAQQSLQVTQQPAQAAAWRHVPTTYLVCTQDRGTPAQAQREFARKAANIVEIDAGHHPFLSQPAVVGDLVLSLQETAAPPG
ncbi:MAG: alpha/beta hydrolase [Actinomycetota bacterium]|nr:alpha/beta hydrolase [Actinomycetota bacterium]